jgi:WD40 repeat protein/serine/threonine protein kinase
MDETGSLYLGNYRLVRLLGQGGYARVYLGEHVRLGTQAAIKVLSTHLSEEDIQNFLAEARAIAHLEHPHIIRILDFAVEHDTPFLVMSYAPNGTLRQRYPKGKSLPLGTIFTYLRQIASALQCAHDARLIHRDVKPENMLLGRYNEILLSDFGVAVMAHSSRSQSMQDVIGTLAYMAPEQLAGKPRPASDQYALGVVVYEWLCGTPPFEGTAAEITAQHLRTAPPALHERVPVLPASVEEVVFKALEKDPHQRFASVQEFADAFESAWRRSLPEESIMLSSGVSVLNEPVQAAFYTVPTQRVSGSQVMANSITPVQEINSPQLAASVKQKGRMSRRALLFGGIGLVGVTGAGSALAALAHAQEQAARSSLGSTLEVYTGQTNQVTTVAWSPDSRRVVSGSVDNTAQVWDALTGAHRLVYRGQAITINDVAWSPSFVGQHIASACGNSLLGSEHDVQIWDANSGRHILTFTGHGAPVHAVAWSPDGTRIVSGDEYAQVQLWVAAKGSIIGTYSGHKGTISSLSWSLDGTRVASASADTTVQVWSAEDGTLLFALAHTSPVNAVAWSPDGTRIASASGSVFSPKGEHDVRIWDAATGKLILTYHGHAEPVATLAWSPDGTRIASASNGSDKTVHLWDAATGATTYIYRGHMLAVNAVAWSPSGKYLASASNDGTVRVWLAST